MEAQSELRERYSAAPTSVDNDEATGYTENISVDRTEDVGDGINRGYEGNAPRSETQRAPEGSASSNDGRRISPRSGKKNRIEKAPDWGSYSKKARTAIVSDVVSFLNEYGTEECWEARADYRKDSDFVADLYKNTYQKSGGNRTLFETYAKGYTTEPGNLFKAFEDNISKDARTETGDGRFDLVERYSLAPVPAVEPSNDSWNRTHTTEEAMEIYPDLWNVSAEESETRNPTQIASTQGTYRNIYKILQDQGFDGKILEGLQLVHSQKAHVRAAGQTCAVDGTGAKAGLDLLQIDPNEVLPAEQPLYQALELGLAGVAVADEKQGLLHPPALDV